MNQSDEDWWALLGEFRAPYVASAIVIAVMTKAEGKRFLGPISSTEASNLFNEVYGIDMSRLTIEPSLDLLCAWGLGNRVEDPYVDAKYVFDWDHFDLYYDRNWNDKSGLIYKIRAVGPDFLREAIGRSEDAAAKAFENGERPGRLVEHSAKAAQTEPKFKLASDTALTKFGSANEVNSSNRTTDVDWTKWGTIFGGVGIIVTIIIAVIS